MIAMQFSLWMMYHVRHMFLVVMLAFCCLFPVFAAGADEDTGKMDYQFFIRTQVQESIAATCRHPCASPYVAKVDLYLEGGFTILENTVTGAGTIKVQPSTECDIIQQHGGGAGSSCRIAGAKEGHFTVSGQKTGMEPVSGKTFVPRVKLTLHPTVWPDLIVNFFLSLGGGGPQPYPVNHYQGSYQALMEQAGIINSPFEILAVAGQNWMSEQQVQQITRPFASEIQLAAPGFLRTLKAYGIFAFQESPFRLEPLQ